MNALTIVNIGFLILEATNVVALYFFPDSKLANSVGVFKAWEKSKQDPEMHDFVKYLVNWVAGTKLVFILLLIVIVYTADQQTLLLTGVALVVSISSFFWRLFPPDTQDGSGFTNRAQELLCRFGLDDPCLCPCVCGCDFHLIQRITIKQVGD